MALNPSSAPFWNVMDGWGETAHHVRTCFDCVNEVRARRCADLHVLHIWGEEARWSDDFVDQSVCVSRTFGRNHFLRGHLENAGLAETYSDSSTLFSEMSQTVVQDGRCSE